MVVASADGRTVYVLLYRTGTYKRREGVDHRAVNVFVAILVSGCLFRQETIHARQMIGCLIGFAGVVLINLNGVDFHMQANGEGFILLSTIAYAFSSVFLKRYSAKHNPVMLSGYQFIAGGII